MVTKEKKERGFIYKTLSILYRILALLLVLILGALAYLTIFGFPDRIVQSQVDAFNRREQLGISVGRIRLYPPDGIVIQDLVVQGSYLDSHPLFECENIWIRVNWREFPDFLNMFSKAHLENGRANLRIHDEEDGAPTLRLANIYDIDAQFSFDGELYRLDSASARSGLASVEASGTIRHTERPVDEPERPRWELRDWVHTRFPIEYLKYRNQKHNIDRWHLEYDDVELTHQVHGKLSFHIDTYDKEDRIFEIDVSSESIICRGMQLDNAVFLGKLDGRDFLAEHISFENENEEAQASFKYNLDTRLLDMKGSGRLAGESLITLLPEVATERISDFDLELEGMVEGSIEFEPTLVSDLDQSFSADIDARDFKFRDIPVDRLKANIRRDKDMIYASSARLASESVEAEGEVEYNLEDRSFKGRGSGRFDPELLLDFVDADQAKAIVGSIELGETYPEFNGRVEGSFEDWDLLKISGGLLMSDFKYNGAPYQRFRSDIDYFQRVLEFDDFTLRRPEGVATGWVKLDLAKSIVELDASSACCPSAIVSIIDPEWAQLIDRVKFDGPVQVSAAGIVNWESFEYTDLEATVSASQVGFIGYSADKLSFSCRLLDNELMVEDISGRIYDGNFQGELLLRMQADDEESEGMRYELKIAAENMQLERLVENMRAIMEIESDADLEVYEGIITLDSTLNGYITEEGNEIERGTYELEIRDGRLFRIPLLGGLSQYLSRTIPGFGYLSQTELVSWGRIRPNSIHIRDVQLQGTVLTVRARGHYYFDHTLDVDVKVVPMRSGYTATIMRVLTYPVSKLLEFTLTGTIEEPEWKPTNLPRQIFLQFD